jgi:hypothetical protein
VCRESDAAGARIVEAPGDGVAIHLQDRIDGNAVAERTHRVAAGVCIPGDEAQRVMDDAIVLATAALAANAFDHEHAAALLRLDRFHDPARVRLIGASHRPIALPPADHVCEPIHRVRARLSGQRLGHQDQDDGNGA